MLSLKIVGSLVIFMRWLSGNGIVGLNRHILSLYVLNGLKLSGVATERFTRLCCLALLCQCHDPTLQLIKITLGMLKDSLELFRVVA